MKKKPIKTIPRLDAEVRIPGSKSYTARALVVGALASGETLLRNRLCCEDAHYMMQGLEAMGVRFVEGPEGLLARGVEGRLSPPAAPIFLGGAGTAVRFLTTVAGLTEGRVIIDGNERMRERPIQDLLDALGPLGIVARSINGSGCPPVLIEGGHFEGGKTTLRGSTSSQFLSSILLAAPCAGKEVEVEISGDLVSRSYVDVTMAIMRDFGAQVAHEKYRLFKVSPGAYAGRQYDIESDLSSASYFFAAAAVTGGRIRVKGINPRTSQGDKGLLDALAAMGCRVGWAGTEVEVVGGPLRAIEVDMRTMPDSVPTLAVVAAFARGTTRISGVGHLRFKETDRLAALEAELRKVGIQATAVEDFLLVQGGRPRGAEIETYKDHRLAMAFAVAGLRVPGIVIRDPDCVDKSFPMFWARLEALR